MNTICWFQRKEEGISRANKRSITGRPASPRYSTMTMLAEAHFLHPPSYTRLWHVCSVHVQSLANLNLILFPLNKPGYLVFERERLTQHWLCAIPCDCDCRG